MGGWVRYLQLQAKLKSGLSTSVAVWAVIGLVGLLAAFVFLAVAAFVWLDTLFDALAAALIMAGVFFVIVIIAVLGCYAAHRSAITKARLALAERKHQPWLDPAMLGMGLQIGRNVGWSRLLSLGAVAVLAAGLGREWFGHKAAPPDDSDQADS